MIKEEGRMHDSSPRENFYMNWVIDLFYAVLGHLLLIQCSVCICKFVDISNQKA